MPLVPEFRFFETCLDKEKKNIMIGALESHLILLEKSNASEIRIRETRWLKDEIEKMKTCP